MKFQPVHEKFILSPQSVDMIVGNIETLLGSLKLERKNALQIRFSIEHVLLLWLGQLEGNDGEFSITKKFGRPYIKITVDGAECSEELADEDFSEYSQSIMEHIGMRPNVFYKNNKNQLTLKVKQKSSGFLKNIAIAIVLAVVIALVLRMLPREGIVVAEAIIDPLFSTFLGVLSTIAGPMIFLSVTWGIYSIGDVATLGRLGKKIMLRFLALTLVMSAVGFFGTFYLFNLNVQSTNIDISQFEKVYGMILAFFPSNIVEPFATNNAIQIIVIAIALGITMIVLERKATVAAKIIEQANYIVQFLMEIISKFVPIFIFVSVFRMIVSDDSQNILVVGKLIISAMAVAALATLAVIFYVTRKFGASFSLMLKKLMPSFLIAISTASSAASMGTTLETCEKKLGIHRKLINFGIPIGTVMFKPACASGNIIIALAMSEVYGVSISPVWVVTAILICGILAIALPPIPGGAITCYTIIFLQLGIPTEAISLVLIADVFLDFIQTASNVINLEMEMVLEAKGFGMLDEKKLRS